MTNLSSIFPSQEQYITKFHSVNWWKISHRIILHMAINWDIFHDSAVVFFQREHKRCLQNVECQYLWEKNADKVYFNTTGFIYVFPIYHILSINLKLSNISSKFDCFPIRTQDHCAILEDPYLSLQHFSRVRIHWLIFPHAMIHLTIRTQGKIRSWRVRIPYTITIFPLLCVVVVFEYCSIWNHFQQTINNNSCSLWYRPQCSLSIKRKDIQEIPLTGFKQRPLLPLTCFKSSVEQPH